MKTVVHDMVVVMKPPSDLLSLEALARLGGVHPALVERYVDFGLMNPCERSGSRIFFEPGDVLRLIAIGRLRRSLGVNLAGIAVALDLIDHIAALQLEVDRLRRGKEPADGAA